MGPRTLVWILVLAGLAGGCATAAPEGETVGVADTVAATTTPADVGVSGATIVEALRADGRFTTLVALYTTEKAASDRDPDATFADVLGDPEGRDWTVLAPTDAAFEALGDDVLTALQEGPWLTSVLHRHMIPGTVHATDLDGGSMMTEGGPVTVVVEGDDVRVEGVTVVETGLEVDNGVIHVLDGVILAPHVLRDLGLEAD